MCAVEGRNLTEDVDSQCLIKCDILCDFKLKNKCTYETETKGEPKMKVLIQ